MHGNKIIDFNTHKINQIIKDMCEKYHERQEYFLPLVNELLKRRPDVKLDEISEELDSFMTIKRIQERN